VVLNRKKEKREKKEIWESEVNAKRGEEVPCTAYIRGKTQKKKGV